MTAPSTFAARVKERRELLQLSQAELAKRVGISQVAIKKIEGGGNTRHGRLLAEALGVTLTYLETGLDDDQRGIVETALPAAGPETQTQTWPFRTISEADIRALPAGQLSALEGALALAIAQMRLGIAVSPPSPPASRPASVPLRGHEAGGLVDIDHANDEFPMQIVGLPAAPWDGGQTTFQAERNPQIRISTQTGVIANVGAGEPLAANDKFEKIPELADVRLAAGDPIENHAEAQTGMIQFRRSFLKAVGADNGRARVVYAKGDSMEPVIRDGAALLVVPNESLTLRDIATGGVYAINYDGKMIVKTVTRDRLTKQWVARSFNPTYPDIPLENGTPVRVLGQVVWSGARLGDDEAGQWQRT
ncbi:XRE family transcriptional regulator [Achromobacter anxifer]